MFRLKIISYLLLSFLFALSATAGRAQTAPVKDDSIEFDFTDLGGKAHKFSEFRGRVVLLDFWATWCAPCLADIPKLKAVYEKHKAQGFEIVGMNVETLGDDAATDVETAKENAERVKQTVTGRKISWMIGTTETAVPVATKVFGIESLPAKILIDRDGKIIAELSEKDDLEIIVGKLLDAKQ